MCVLPSFIGLAVSVSHRLVYIERYPTKAANKQFHLISFILVVTSRTLRKVNLFTVLANDPNGEKTRKEVSV